MSTTFLAGKMAWRVFSDSDLRTLAIVLARLAVLTGDVSWLISWRLLLMLSISPKDVLMSARPRIWLIDLPIKRMDEAVAEVVKDGSKWGIIAYSCYIVSVYTVVRW